jgi:hypothetical protein
MLRLQLVKAVAEAVALSVSTRPRGHGAEHKDCWTEPAEARRCRDLNISGWDMLESNNYNYGNHIGKVKYLISSYITISKNYGYHIEDVKYIISYNNRLKNNYGYKILQDILKINIYILVRYLSIVRYLYCTSRSSRIGVRSCQPLKSGRSLRLQWGFPPSWAKQGHHGNGFYIAPIKMLMTRGWMKLFYQH